MQYKVVAEDVDSFLSINYIIWSILGAEFFFDSIIFISWSMMKG